jgi:hypothetical protein
MTWLADLWANEPIVITGLVGAILGLLVTFGLKIDPDQIAAIDAVIVAVGVFIARSKASSPATVAKLVAQIPPTATFQAK